MGAGHVVALGERARVECLALGGAIVAAADEPAAVREAWSSLPPDVAVVVVTAAAEAVLRHEVAGRGRPLRVVMPP